MADQLPEPTPQQHGEHQTRNGRITTDDAAGAEARSFQTKPGDTEPVNQNNDAEGWPLTADPAALAHARDQGLGLGQKALDAHRDPAAGADAEEADMANDPDPKGAKS